MLSKMMFNQSQRSQSKSWLGKQKRKQVYNLFLELKFNYNIKLLVIVFVCRFMDTHVAVLVRIMCVSFL